MEPQEIKYTCLRAGQPKPYADSYYEWEVYFSQPEDEYGARNFARYLRGCKRFADEGKWESDMDRHFAPHIQLTPTNLKRGVLGLRANEWRILVTEAYTD